MARTAFGRTRQLTHSALTAKQRLDAAVEPTAIRIGWAGLAVLAGCIVMSALPMGLWPRALTPRLLLVIGVVSLVCASFLGWAAVRRGQERLKRKVPHTVGTFLFFVLPITVALMSLVHTHVWKLWPVIPQGHEAWWFIRWYVPGLVALSLVTFVGWRSRSFGRIRRKELAWAGLIVAPYVLLAAVLVWGGHVPGVDASLRATLATLGEWAIVMQVTLAWFVG